jgi:hypothetical protein
MTRSAEERDEPLSRLIRDRAGCRRVTNPTGTSLQYWPPVIGSATCTSGRATAATSAQASPTSTPSSALDLIEYDGTIVFEAFCTAVVDETLQSQSGGMAQYLGRPQRPRRPRLHLHPQQDLRQGDHPTAMTAAHAGRRCEPEASSLGPAVIQRVQEASAAIHAGRPLAFLDSALSDAMTPTHRLPRGGR